MKAAYLTDLAAEWLRERYPEDPIVRELTVAHWGSASIDVAAISSGGIIGIEVKGDTDGPGRLYRQGLAYGMAVRWMWLLPAPGLAAKCRKLLPEAWSELEVFDGRVRPRNRAMVAGEWLQQKDGRWKQARVPDPDRYIPERDPMTSPYLSANVMLGVLWVSELRDAVRERFPDVRVRKIDGDGLRRILVERLPTPEVHDLMIAALRRRDWSFRGDRVSEAPSTTKHAEVRAT